MTDMIIEQEEQNRSYLSENSVCDFLQKRMQKYADYPAITDEYNKIEATYAELNEQSTLFAAALQHFGVKKGDYIGVFSENHGRWLFVDQGILRTGAIDVVRGSNAPIEELDYIISHSKMKALVLRDENILKKLAPILSKYTLSFIVLMFGGENIDKTGLNSPVFSYNDMIKTGKKSHFSPVSISKDDEVTVLYTSGTTGYPKGVVLTNKNILYQLIECHSGFLSQPGENTLHILPIWHAYERIGKYYFASCGCHLHYTTLSGLKNDLLKYHIDTMMSVPRIWEALKSAVFQKIRQKSKFAFHLFNIAINISITYKIHKMYSEHRITNKKNGYHSFSDLRHTIQRSFLKPFHVLFARTLYKKLKDMAGLNLRASISGGGALSMQDELFYDAIGVNLRIGYGLTETAPVITLRGVQDKNYLGSAGKPIKGTEVKIVDPQTKKELGIFTKGLIMVRGPQIMKGYLNDEKATKAVIDKDGWFNTGDLGWLTKENNLVLVGRLKETIVLSSGENVEPTPIEEACLQSPYIEQIVLVGQDKNAIGALVIPSSEALEKCGIAQKDLKSNQSIPFTNSILRDLIKREIDTNIKNKPNLKVFEKIKQFEVMKEGFSVDNGMMTQSAKIKRNKVFEKYEDVISKMYASK